MKKSFIAIVAAAAAFAATATTVGVGYEYMGVADQAGKTQQQNSTVRVSQSTDYGTVDGALVYDTTNGTQGNQTGYEIGYLYPIAVAGHAVIPRVFAGNLGALNVDGHYAGAGAEARFPLFGFDTFIAADYRLNTAAAAVNEKTYQAGVDYQINKDYSVRAALKHANYSNVEFQNGVAVTVKYAF